MSDDIQPQERCPFLGTSNDPETWYGFPTRDNLCHKIQDPESASLSYQAQHCLSATYRQCQIFQADGKVSGSLPPDLKREVGATREITRRWDTTWTKRVHEEIALAQNEQGDDLQEVVEETGELVSESETTVSPDDATEEQAEDDQASTKLAAEVRKESTTSINLLDALPGAPTTQDDEEQYFALNSQRSRKVAPGIILIISVVLILGVIGIGVFSLTDTGASILNQRANSTPETLDTPGDIAAPTSPTNAVAPSDTPLPTTTMVIEEATSAPTESSATDVPVTSASDSEPFDAILANDSNLRNGPGTAFEILDYLTAGTHTLILGRDGPGLWVLVRLEDNREGWIVATQFIGDIGVENLPVVPNSAP